MTSAEWRACRSPEAMLNRLRDRASDRKLRLYAVACCRRVWPLLCDERSRRAVEVAERFADGDATRQELAGARGAQGIVFAAAPAARAVAWDAAWNAAWDAAWEARVAARDSGTTTWEAERFCQALLLHDLFGDPCANARLEPACLAWNGGCVGRIARAIYQERNYHDLPVLADALADAGCDWADLLAHCRTPAGHVRGCWALDLVLKKS